MFRKILAAIICIFTLATGLTSCGFFPSNNSGENISHEEALDIAKEYWKDRDIEKNGYIVAEVVNQSAPKTVYVFVLKRLVQGEENSHYSTIDEIWIDKATGEVKQPYGEMK